jgi:hypothetical protein
MAVLSCPHCGTVIILVGVTEEPILAGYDIETEICPKFNCRRRLVRLTEPDAGAAIRKAFYGHDHAVEAVTITAEKP